LATLLEFLSSGDTLVFARIYRLTRSVKDLQDIIRELHARGVTLKATKQPIDTSSAAGKCFVGMLGVFAKFEINLRKERQLEGIAAAKDAGVYKGRKAEIDPERVRQLAAKGMGGGAIAKELGIGRTTVYRLLDSEHAL
jgi:DNA invertase Pin-like site-specific DNA recombinase